MPKEESERAITTRRSGMPRSTQLTPAVKKVQAMARLSTTTTGWKTPLASTVVSPRARRWSRKMPTVATTLTAVAPRTRRRCASVQAVIRSRCQPATPPAIT